MTGALGRCFKHPKKKQPKKRQVDMPVPEKEIDVEKELQRLEKQLNQVRLAARCQGHDKSMSPKTEWVPH